jgi:hypothetical protein
VKYNTDGQKDRTVRVIVSGYGVSDTCTMFVPLKLINPLTVVTGPNNLCSDGTYKLTLDPPAATTTTWVVTSLTSGNPPPVTPLSGTGMSAMLSLVNGSANCMITFTITGCGKTTVLRDTFFAGKPIISNMIIDGQPTSSQVVCRGGYHYMSASVFGVTGPNVCMEWLSLYGQPLVITCNTAQVFMPEVSGPVVAKITATNECGSTEAFFYLWPGQKCKGLPAYALTISPNPATNMISIQVLNEETMVVGTEPIKDLCIINQFGGIVLSNNSPQTLHQFQIGQIPEGLYSVQAKVGDEIITAPLLIKRQ